MLVLSGVVELMGQWIIKAEELHPPRVQAVSAVNLSVYPLTPDCISEA